MHIFDNFRVVTEQGLLDSLPRTLTRLAPPALLTQELHGGEKLPVHEIAALRDTHLHHVTAGKMLSEMIHGFRGEYDEDGEWYSKFVINLHIAVLVSLLSDQGLSAAGQRNWAHARAYREDLEFVSSLTEALMGGSLWEFGYIKTLVDGSCATYIHSIPWFDAQEPDKIWKFLSGKKLPLGNDRLKDEFRKMLNGKSPLSELLPDYKALPSHRQYAQYLATMRQLAAAYPPAEEIYGARVYGTEKFSNQMVRLPEFQAFSARRDQLNGLYAYYVLAWAGALPGSVELRFRFSKLYNVETSSR